MPRCGQPTQRGNYCQHPVAEPGQHCRQHEYFYAAGTSITSSDATELPLRAVSYRECKLVRAAPDQLFDCVAHPRDQWEAAMALGAESPHCLLHPTMSRRSTTIQPFTIRRMCATVAPETLQALSRSSAAWGRILAQMGPDSILHTWATNPDHWIAIASNPDASAGTLQTIIDGASAGPSRIRSLAVALFRHPNVTVEQIWHMVSTWEPDAISSMLSDNKCPAEVLDRASRDPSLYDRHWFAIISNANLPTAALLRLQDEETDDERRNKIDAETKKRTVIATLDGVQVAADGTLSVPQTTGKLVAPSLVKQATALQHGDCPTTVLQKYAQSSHTAVRALAKYRLALRGSCTPSEAYEQLRLIRRNDQYVFPHYRTAQLHLLSLPGFPVPALAQIARTSMAPDIRVAAIQHPACPEAAIEASLASRLSGVGEAARRALQRRRPDAAPS